MKKTVNVRFTESQYRAIQKNAKALEIKPGTWCKLAALSAAGVQFSPDSFQMPTTIKQLNLFDGRRNQ